MSALMSRLFMQAKFHHALAASSSTKHHQPHLSIKNSTTLRCLNPPAPAQPERPVWTQMQQQALLMPFIPGHDEVAMKNNDSALPKVPNLP
jgi:hypothetical protein